MKPYDHHADILWLEEADSTNSVLRKQIDKRDNLSIIAARSQSAGRGQGSHTWFASPDTNLTFSVLYRFTDGELLAKDEILLTCVTTLALRDYLLSRGIEARIKWPNDIWIGDRKICGILIENTLKGASVATSIVGIGLNVNETRWPSDLPNPVSMKDLTGRTYNLEEELEALHKEICRRYAQLGTADGRISLQEEFEKYMFRLPEGLK